MGVCLTFRNLGQWIWIQRHSKNACLFLLQIEFQDKVIKLL